MSPLKSTSKSLPPSATLFRDFENKSYALNRAVPTSPKMQQLLADYALRYSLKKMEKSTALAIVNEHIIGECN